MAEILFNGTPTAQIDFIYTPDSDDADVLSFSGSIFTHC
jgi:hypothetical protein